VQPRPEPQRRDEEDWVEIFATWGREGTFQQEPDFDRALANVRDAIATAKAQTDPPFEPPIDFRPDSPRWVVTR